MPEPLTPRQILETLVGFPTVSSDGNRDLNDWIAGYLQSFGISPVRVQNPSDPNKSSLYAHVGPLQPGGVMLSGHTDVVPVTGQTWSSDPFEVHERDGRLYGRGCADMKGFDALAIWALVEAHLNGVQRSIQLALSHDEEVGCLEAPAMIDHMLANPDFPKADLVIVGEPSNMQAVTGHKGMVGFDVDIHGFAVHSSLLPRGVNAVMEGARLIGWANDRNADRNAALPTKLAARFDPPWTTTHVGMIKGGVADNITAEHCQFSIDARLVPGETPEGWETELRARVASVETGMKAIQPQTGITLSPKFAIPPLAPETDGAAERLVRALTGDNASHVVSYATEAGQFQERGFSAVVCGPGSIEQAHQPDEFITLEQFAAGHKFMKQLLTSLQD